LIEGFPVDPDEFLTTMHSEVTKKLTWGDFSLARRWGINGFPALLARHDDQAAHLTTGWASPTDADAALHAWLENRAPGMIEAPSCDLDTGVC
ncbi:MAG: hypothetical protein OEX97_06265, partial [Acidimicrobiia bacterium]|nr:hypothetical protein [Acidimicrobiia bacterium]